MVTLSWANKEEINDYHAEFVDRQERVEQFIKNAWADHVKGVRPTSPYLMSVSMQVQAMMAQYPCSSLSPYTGFTIPQPSIIGALWWIM